MSDRPAFTWRAPLSLALLALAVALAWLAAAAPASAGGSGAIALDPAAATVGVGGTTDVDAVVTPPDDGLSIWIIEVEIEDTSIVRVNETGSGVDCAGGQLPGGGAGASVCDAKNTDADPELDTVVALGGYVRNEGGNPVGIEAVTVLATIGFEGVGDPGECTDLNVSQSAFLSPDDVAFTPVITSGEICITTGQTVTWGDVDCSESADPVDGLKVLRFDAGLPADTGDCPEMGNEITAGGNTVPWGDVDCTESADPVDGLKILRFDAGLGAETGDCPEIGDEVQIS
jgi:hypothetical protein